MKKGTSVADQTASALLSEILDLLSRQPSLTRRGQWAREGRALAQRISMYLAGLEFGPLAVTALRDRWALSGFIRVDPDEKEFEQTDNGYWVRAWVKIGRLGLDAGKDLLRERYEAAVSSLPLMTREVFDARQTEGLEDHVIAKRYGIQTREVEQLVADALLSISRALLMDRTE